MNQTNTDITVAISSRWKPGHVIRIDTIKGTYEEVNPPMVSESEANVQSALLSSRARQHGYPLLWWLSMCCIALGSAVMIVSQAAKAPM